MTWEDFILLRLSKETKETCIFWGYIYMLLGTNGKHFLQVLIFLQVTRAPGIPSRVRYQKTNQIAWFPTDFQPYFPAYEKELPLCSHWKVCSGPMRSFLSWLHICFHFVVQSSEFCWPFVFVFDSGNSIVSGGNWCPYQKPFTMHKSKCPAPKLEILHPNQKGTMQVIIGRWPLVHIIYEVILEKPDHFIWKWMNCDKRCYVMSLRLTLLKISRSQYEWIWMNIFVSAFCYDLIKFTSQ